MIVETVKGRIYRTFFNANSGKVGNSISEVYQGEPLSRKGVAWYFSVGYVPGDLTLFENIYCLPGGARCEVQVGGYRVLDRFYYEDMVDVGRYSSVPYADLLSEGHRILVEVVEKEFLKNRNMALGLTGGLDSRLLLGALLEVTEARNIKSFSWGFEDTYDFEIGNAIAKRYGIAHRAYDLNRIPFGMHNLESFALLSDCNTNLFDQPPVAEISRDFSDATIWYGVLGGTASGSNLPRSKVERPASHYLSTERRRAGRLADLSYSIVGDTISPMDVESLMGSCKYADHDMIDIYNHHERLICHAVFFKGFKYSVPFGSDEWLSFTLSLPGELRGTHRKFLIESIKRYYPVLAKFPSANLKGMSLFLGLRERLLTRMLNLIVKKRNYRKKFLDLGSLYKNIEWKDIVEANLLNNRIQWLDMRATTAQMIDELRHIDHWKSMELMLSLSVIAKVLNKGNCE